MSVIKKTTKMVRVNKLDAFIDDNFQLLTQLQEYVVVKDLNSRFKFTNNETARFFGFENADEMINLNDHD